MGRVKTRDIKKAALDMVKNDGDKFKATFRENKDVLKEMNLVQTKRNKNKIAGYITRTVKRVKK